MTRVTPAGRALLGLVVLVSSMAAVALPASAASAAYPEVTKVKLSDKKVDPGESLDVSLKAKNETSHTSRPMNLRFILSDSHSPDGGKLLRSATVPEIKADDDRKLTFDITVPTATKPGKYRVLVAQARTDKADKVLDEAKVKVKGEDGGSDDGDNSSAGSSDGAPARVLDLTNWKLTLPIGKSKHDATEVEQPDLKTYQNDTYFHIDGSGKGVVFRANADGATTSGSTYPRSELREMTDHGKDEASWSSKSGDHVMTVTEAITATPAVKPHVVAAQIHDSEDDVVMIRLEKNRLFVEADGDDVGVLDPAYVLGTKFTVELRATSSGIRITYNGSRVVKYTKTGSGYYFKAGCYTQSNVDKGDKPDAYGEVVIYALSVRHS